MSPDGEDLTKDQLLYYGEVCRSHEKITDFRAKLLALLPIASATGIGLLVTQADGNGGISPWLLVVLGPFGALVTLGLFFYEFHQMDDCQQLRNHGVWIEQELLKLDAGQFGSKRGNLKLRHIWPSKYRERDEMLRKPEQEGKPSGELVLGAVNVRNADYIVYGSVFVAWILVLVWGIWLLA